MRKFSLTLIVLALLVAACVRNQPEVIVITATFQPPTAPPMLATIQAQSTTGSVFVQPTAQPTAIALNPQPDETPRQYIVQPGDTMLGIAAANGVSLQSLLALNPLPNPDALVVGQLILLPAPPSQEGSAFKIIPDSRLVRAPGSAAFDIESFINQQPGFIRIATDMVDLNLLTSAQIVERVSLEFSVDPRILLALLEYQSAWLTNLNPDETARTYPIRIGASALGVDRAGLYRQLTWAADQLNFGYYGWKTRGLTTLEFQDGVRLLYATSLNAGTVGIQRLFSQLNDSAAWAGHVSEAGLYQTYVQLFGDPFQGAIDPLVPSNLQQPTLTLPFPQGQRWYYTGGPHGGWGAGSAWAAVDFAPPDDITTVTSSCYVSSFFATAVAPGIIARTDEGTVVLDLDGDGDESTGWTILYLHLDTQDRIAQGTVVAAGDRVGRPSCEGGFSNGTHMHIARRYNGEWIPADCSACLDPTQAPPLVLGGWMAEGIANQEYQGFLTNGAQRKVAEQGRGIADNEVGW